jgi:hypothetical protein
MRLKRQEGIRKKKIQKKEQVSEFRSQKIEIEIESKVIDTALETEKKETNRSRHDHEHEYDNGHDVRREITQNPTPSNANSPRGFSELTNSLEGRGYELTTDWRGTEDDMNWIDSKSIWTSRAEQETD